MVSRNLAPKIAAVGATLALSVGVAACESSDQKKSDAAVSCIGEQRLTDMSFDGSSAKNTGECARVYDAETAKIVGELAAGASFTIVCVEEQPGSIAIETEDLQGSVELSNMMTIAVVSSPDLQTVPTCE